jgi:hypothetical protein
LPTLVENLRAEIQALTYPVRHKTKYRLHALANDALDRLSRPARFEESFAEQWRRIVERSNAALESAPPAGSPRILFGSMYGQKWVTRPVEATMAMALRLRGATPTILACDHALPACEWNPLGNHDPDPGSYGAGRWHNASRHTCTACTLKLEETYGLPGIDRLALRDFVRPGDLERARSLADGIKLSELRSFFYRDINVGEHAYAALLRATLRGTLLDDEKTRWLGRRFIASAIVLVDAGERVLEHVRPERFVVGDGVYLLAGTLSELAQKRDIHVVVHGTPYRKGTVWLSHKDCYHRVLITERDGEWNKLEMTPERSKVAEDYLASKHLVARDYITYHVDSIQDHSAIRRELGLDERPIVSLFTNILWDSQLYYRFKVFPDMIEWLFQTIRFYERRPDLQLVVRLHPGEARSGVPTNQPLSAELEREFSKFPENVKIVAPDSRVSSYGLGEMSNLALIYGARMGVELVMLGTPVIVAGEAFMRGKGISYDPTTREDYFELLEQGAGLPRPSAEIRARAAKWYYYYFFRIMMPFSFYEIQRVNGEDRTRLTFRSLDDLFPGRSPVLDRICQGVIDGTTRFEWDEFER